MEIQALISVIIPVYNVEEYLHECVGSVINQTYKNLEIILVDDGSTDSSGRICDEYAKRDTRITVIHKKNDGPSKTRNVGLGHANGKYIYFIDSDDFIEKTAIEALVYAAESNQADLVFFDAASFADDGSEVKQGYIIKGTYKVCNGYKMLAQLHNNNDYHCAIYLLFIKRQLLFESNINFLESAYCSEDMLFTYQVYCCAKTVAQCKQSLYNRRYRQNSIVTSSKTQRHFHSCKNVFEAVRDYSESIGKLNDKTANRYTVRCAFNALDVYKKLTKADKLLCKSEYKALKKDILSDSAFGNTALKMRCYGKLFWFVYKIYEKTAGRLLKGKK